MRKRSRSLRSGITGYRIYELLTGKIAGSLISYAGYDADGKREGRLEDYNEFDRDEIERDWKEHGEALTAFWKSGEYTDTETLRPFGFDVKIPICYFSCGGPKATPWAATFLAKTKTPARKTKRVTKRATQKTAAKRATQAQT